MKQSLPANEEFFGRLDQLSGQYGVVISWSHVSPLVYTFTCSVDYEYLQYTMSLSKVVRVRSSKGGVLPMGAIVDIEGAAAWVKGQSAEYGRKLSVALRINGKPYIKSFEPRSQYEAKSVGIENIVFVATFRATMFEEYVLGGAWKKSFAISEVDEGAVERAYRDEYARLLSREADKALFLHMLGRNSMFQGALANIRALISSYGCSDFITVSYDSDAVYIKVDHKVAYIWDLDGGFTDFIPAMESDFQWFISRVSDRLSEARAMARAISSCANGAWVAEFSGGGLSIHLKDPCSGANVCRCRVTFNYNDNVRGKVERAMLSLLEYAENHKGTRYFWG